MTQAPPPDEMTNTQRMVLRYLYRCHVEKSQKSVAYRQCRREIERMVRPMPLKGETGRFNWGFETQFATDLHELADWGMIDVQYGTGGVLVKRSTRRTIHSVGLAEGGQSLAKLLYERYRQAPGKTTKVIEAAPQNGEDRTAGDTASDTRGDQ